MAILDVPVNLAFDNYAELSAVIEDWLNRTDLTGAVPSMIALCESRLRRELSPLLGEVSASVAVVDGVGELPTDYAMAVRVIYDNKALPDYSATAAPNVPHTGTYPEGFTIEAGALRLWPAVDATVTLLYEPFLAQLSETNQTNKILQQHPDVYFYGAMVFAEGYVANDSRAALFKSLWDEAIGEVKAFLTRQRFAGPLVPRLAFVP